MAFFKTARLINLLTLGIFAGVLFGTWLGVSPKMLTLTASTYTDIQQSMIGSLDPTMPILASLALLSGIAILWQLRSNSKSKIFIFTALSVLCFVIALAFTFAVNVPLNIEIVGWSVNSPPENWVEIRSRWEQAHGFRTLASVLAFLFQLLAFYDDSSVSTIEKQ